MPSKPFGSWKRTAFMEVSFHIRGCRDPCSVADLTEGTLSCTQATNGVHRDHPGARASGSLATPDERHPGCHELQPPAAPDGGVRRERVVLEVDPGLDRLAVLNTIDEHVGGRDLFAVDRRLAALHRHAVVVVGAVQQRRLERAARGLHQLAEVAVDRVHGPCTRRSVGCALSRAKPHPREWVVHCFHVAAAERGVPCPQPRHVLVLCHDFPLAGS